MQRSLPFCSTQIQGSTCDIATKNLLLNSLNRLINISFQASKVFPNGLYSYLSQVYGKTLEDKKIIEDIVQLTIDYYHALVDTKQPQVPHAIKQMAKLFENQTKVKAFDVKGKMIESRWTNLSYKEKHRILSEKVSTFFGRVQTEVTGTSTDSFTQRHDRNLITTLKKGGFIS